MSQLATLHIDKQAHKFSAAHFTIFSETDRERLHGHNYGVSARIVAAMGDNGFRPTTTCTSGHCSDFATTTMSTCCCRVSRAG